MVEEEQREEREWKEERMDNVVLEAGAKTKALVERQNTENNFPILITIMLIILY